MTATPPIVAMGSPTRRRVRLLFRADVHVRDGRIIAVAHHIDVNGAEVIDASRCIVIPGFVEVHWHMWNGIWRGRVGGEDAAGEDQTSGHAC